MFMKIDNRFIINFLQCSVMLDLLPLSKEYNNENGKKHNLIWKGKLTVLLLYNDLKLNLANIASLYINTVQYNNLISVDLVFYVVYFN